MIRQILGDFIAMASIAGLIYGAMFLPLLFK